MPATYACSFIPDSFGGGALAVWRWDNTDDTGLEAFVESALDGDPYPTMVQDVAVDRSGSTPVLRWQYYTYDGTPTGDFDEMALTPGVFVNPYSRPPYGSPGYAGDRPAALDTPRYWESDQYGRPYDLNDLRAES